MKSLTSTTESSSSSLMFLLGIGALTPWFLVLNEIDYFSHQLPRYNIELWAGIFYCSFAAISLIFLTILSFVFNRSGSMFFIYKAPIGFLLFSILLIGIPLISYIEDESSKYATIISLCAGLGMVDGLTQSGLFGLASVIQSSGYLRSLIAGIGVSGVISSAMRIFTKIFSNAQGIGKNRSWDSILRRDFGRWE
eukprot:TRINITY_DN9528_c0_g1_i1.p1 TRINITY_DN9528_c0_g1~~TRINITY_DN9528_c0_g1_i1.p1  ORF type:complete len:194 (+),score=58.60 TRINITY_DN9528_c0_g1_i1:45-626(+)